MSFEPPFSKFPITWIVRHLDPGEEAVIHDLGYASIDEFLIAQLEGGPTVDFTPPLAVPRGNKLSIVFTREGEDVATCGMHFVHRDGSDLADFTADDRALIEDYIATWWAALIDNFTDKTALDRLVWHDFGVGIRKPNPQITEFSFAGDGSGTHVGTDPLPPQCATSVTFKTSVRRNWGRNYLPATIEGNVTEGRFVSGYCSVVRTAYGDLLDSAAAHNVPLVIWCPRHDGELLQFFKAGVGHPESAHALGLDLPDSTSFARTVDSVQVDDIVDTIRSRRFAKPLVRETHTLGA